MTLTDSSSSAHSPASADPRQLFASCISIGRQTVSGVRTDQLALPTPCDQFNVRDLLGHLGHVLHRVTALGRGEDPFALDFDADLVSDDGWLRAWDEAATEATAAWAGDDVLEATMSLPWVQAPGAVILAGYLSEITVHTWDLATATGQLPDWDAAVVAASFEAIRQMLPEQGREEAPFDDPVEVPASAPAIDRLAAYTGRQP